MNVVLFRGGYWADEGELPTAQSVMPVYQYRTQIPAGSLVIPRYAALPFYQELEHDVKILGSRLINTYAQHRFVADFWQWYLLLQDLTPRSWDSWHNLPQDTSFVLKGSTNSRKNYWQTRMFAKSASDIPRIACSLLDDQDILSQGIVVREYVPLVQYGEGINGLPFTNEWRFFCLEGRVILGGFYWANEPEMYPGDPTVPPEGALFLAQEVALRVKDHIPFSVVDVAEKASGGWIVIEMNDGQQSGLPVCDPKILYEALR